MESLSTPVLIYILAALSVAALISLSVFVIIMGEVGVLVYKRLFSPGSPH